MRRVSERRARKAMREHQRTQDVVSDRMRTISALKLKPMVQAVRDAVQEQINEARQK